MSSLAQYNVKYSVESHQSVVRYSQFDAHTAAQAVIAYTWTQICSESVIKVTVDGRGGEANLEGHEVPLALLLHSLGVFLLGSQVGIHLGAPLQRLLPQPPLDLD